MTDGFVEQFNAAGEMRDYERCAAASGAAAAGSPHEIIDRLFATLDGFRGTPDRATM